MSDATGILLNITHLAEGRAYCISGRWMRDVAGLDLSAFDRPARRDDIEKFAAKLREQHGLRVTENQLSGEWTFFRPEGRESP